VVGLDGLGWAHAAVGHLPHQRHDGERGLGQVDLAAEEGHARAVALGLAQQLERVARGPGAAAQHADDDARVERRQLLQRLRAVVGDLQEAGPLGPGQAGEAAQDAVVDVVGQDVGCQAGLDVRVEDLEEVGEAAGPARGAEAANASSDRMSASRSLLKVIE
jgi:hypothetical protein